MSRYHLNIYDDAVALDDDGAEFTDLAAARAAAISGAREMMAARLVAGRPIALSHRIEITDPAGAVLTILPFGEAMAIEP
jgi:uncharacterized protein DUF6894